MNDVEVNAIDNRYTMTIDINGFKYDNQDGVYMNYQEITDYLNNKHPVRILTIEIPYVDVHSMLFTEKNDHNGVKLYDINIMAKPLDEEGFQNKPIVDGKFKALLRDGDVKNDINESLQDDNRFTEREQGVYQVPLVFYLFREEELNFNQQSINMIVNNPTLSQLWLAGFHMANPNFKVIVSKFEHNPNLGEIIVTPTSYEVFLDYLDKEFGLYSTDYMEFVEHGIYFLLNKNNKINVNCEDLEFTLRVFIGRKKSDRMDKIITKVDDYNYEVVTSVSDVKFTIENPKAFNRSITYFKPSGVPEYIVKSLSRISDVVYKTTEVQHLLQLKNPIYEKIEITLDGESLNFITPLTKLKVNDSSGLSREYRMAGKNIVLRAGQYSSTKIIGFRLVEE